MSSKITVSESFKQYRGEVEIEIRDRHGNLISRHREHNLIKIFAKEMLSHRLPYSKVWDPTASSGTGGWVDSGIDALEEFAAKYILFGASFDSDKASSTYGYPLSSTDTRYYTIDPVTGTPVAKTPDVGADHGGDLINPIPISDPDRPLKKIERAYFEPSYQPPESPLLSSDVRAVNNVLVLETTLESGEYNGFGVTSGDFFAITEVALAGGAILPDTSTPCDCVPSLLFLEGVGGLNDKQIIAVANGSQTITIDPTVDASDVNRIKEGDQIYIVGRSGSAEEYDPIEQSNPYYLALTKAVGGRDIVLDRTPVTSAGAPLTGPIGIYRTTLRLFSQRILSVPFKKSSDFQIICRWRISFA